MSVSNDQAEYNVTVEQAMDILGCSRRTVYRKINNGDIRAEKVATDTTAKWFIHEQDLYDYKVVKDSVNIEEVNKLIDKDTLINEISNHLSEAIADQNKKAITSVNDTLDRQNELLAELLEDHISQLQEELERIQAENESLRAKNKELRAENARLKDKLEEAKQKSLLGKVKGLFK